MKRRPAIKSKHGNPESSTADMDTAPPACQLLQTAEIRSHQLLFSGSNAVFLMVMVADKTEIKIIYKPRQGETPLWDFPDGTLYKREYAAFIVSQALGWHLIPPTIIRHGPFGIGSMQWFVDTVKEGRYYRPVAADLPVLKRVALFDYLVNNADRKAGHFLEDGDGRLWLIDHGLTFNTAPKLRTVLWDFSGQTIPKRLMADVKGLQKNLSPEKQLNKDLRRLLDTAEVEALGLRIERLIENPVFAYPGSRRSMPWPWI